MKIVNLTQHQATGDQIADGVFDLDAADAILLKSILTFNEIPSKSEMTDRAVKIADLSKKYNPTHAMIGGAPYFMNYMEEILRGAGIHPIYSFSKRVSVDSMINGVVEKTSIFKHVGWVGI